MSGLVTRRSDIDSPLLKFEVAASENVNAWLGIRLNVAKGKVTGHTSQIRAAGGTVKSGYVTQDFRVAREDGSLKKGAAAPHETFNVTIEFNPKFDSVLAKVNKKATANVYRNQKLRPAGNVGMFVSRGVLIINSASNSELPQE